MISSENFPLPPLNLQVIYCKTILILLVNATTPVPTAPPRVTWRAGLDLDPVDPMIAARAATEGPTGCFLMAVNGVPVGWTDPHGASLDWISEIPESEG